MASYGAARSRTSAHRTVPGSQPRQPGEDVVSWAVRTGRIRADEAAFWRDRVAASAQAATTVLETLHPGTAVAVTSKGVVDTVAASVPSRPAGADPRIYARNPLVDDMRAMPGSTVYAEAATHGGGVPTLFPEGDLPHATASGISPHVLAGLPWYGRHPVAAAATTAEAEDLIDDLSSPNHLAAEYRDHGGNQDYAARVRHWSMRGIAAAADNRRQAEAAASLRMPAEVTAAAGEAATGELDDDELYDRVFGPSDRKAAEAHLEHLHTIAAGQAVGAAITQVRAREMLEEYTRGNQIAASVPGDGMPRGSRIRVDRDAAQKVLDQLDREVGGRWVSR